MVVAEEAVVRPGITLIAGQLIQKILELDLLVAQVDLQEVLIIHFHR